MHPKVIFQKNLLGSITVVVSVLILVAVAAAARYEKQRFLQTTFTRIYHETLGLKQCLGDLVFASDFQPIADHLAEVKQNNPEILYLVLTDMAGTVLAADDRQVNGAGISAAVTIENVSRPVYRKTLPGPPDGMESRFEIYPARFSGSDKNEAVFDTYWDVVYKKQRLARLRAGYTGRGWKRHLLAFTGVLLTCCFLIFAVTLMLVHRRCRKDLEPLETLTCRLKTVLSADRPDDFRQRLTALAIEGQTHDTARVRQLNQAVLNLKDRFVSDWDQQEARKADLEKEVAQRTRSLYGSNRKLIQQIEERKEIETRLLNVQKLEAVSILAGGVAHEFNNLFMAITGYASLIEKHAGSGHPSAEKAKKIRQLVESGAGSIKQLLSFARGGNSAPGLLNLNGIIRVSVEMFVRTRKDIEMVTRYDEEIWHVVADRSQMEHIVMNLLINASEAMPDNGTIRIETRNTLFQKKTVRPGKTVSGRFVAISVSDDGRGIEKECIPRIFDPFFTTKPAGAGAGLGLASVYGIVDSYQGVITVDSTPGKGSVFNIFFPAKRQEDEQ